VLPVLLFAACGTSASAPPVAQQKTSPTTVASSGTPNPSGASDTSGSSASANGEVTIPDSPAIDALAKDLTKPNTFDLQTKCQFLVTAIEAAGLGAIDSDSVKSMLAKLVTVVTPIDPAVATALAKDPKASAAWCKRKGLSGN
jgi:hypothetical protein